MDVVVSKDILARIRQELKGSLPDVKSSHMAEALAAALGFRTNAALLDWCETHPVLRSARIRSLSGSAFADRLESLTGMPRPEVFAILEQASLKVHASVTGLGYDEAEMNARMEYFDEGDAGNWYASGMTNVDRLAYMMSLLRWRMTVTGVIREFVGNYGKPEGDIHLRLAACFRRHAAYDPMISGFLSEILVAADGDENDLVWADMVYSTFRNRINTYIDAVCRTWDLDVDPMSLLPVSIGERRGRLKPDAVVSISTRPTDNGLSFHDAGNSAPMPADLAGLFVMPHWLNGATHRQLEKDFSSSIEGMAAHTRIVDENGNVLSKAEALARLRPRHPLAELDEGRNWETACVILVSGLDGPRASSLLREAGVSIADIDGAAADVDARVTAALHFNDAVRIDGLGDSGRTDDARPTALELVRKLEILGITTILADPSDDLVAGFSGIEGLVDLRKTNPTRP